MTTTLTDTEKRDGKQDSGQYGIADTGPLEYADETSTRQATICVVGLGYVGLPLAVGFAQAEYRVIGYDIDESTVEKLQQGIDTTGDLEDDVIQDGDISYTTNASAISQSDYVIITVPTPIDEDDRPDMSYVESAARTVGSKMTAGTTVILESTVYPGSTRSVLVPALEEASGLTAGEGFFVGYSPERATPGDSEHGLEDVVKVVGASNESVLEDVAMLYEAVVDVGIHRAPSIEAAEACKVVENAQRDLNIAFANELTRVLEQLNIDPAAVFEAASTKWNFHDYRPGLVGGHCIPVDPYFLAYRSAQEGYDPKLIRTSREVNESMPSYVAEMTIKALNRCGKTLRDSRVLVLGLSYKPNVGDIRSSKVVNVIDELEEYDVDVEGYDPLADDDVVRDAFGIDVQDSLSFNGFDAVMLATPHSTFESLDLEEVATALEATPALIDVTGALEERDAANAGFVYRRL
ncbi:nucleotide sugar dehydrogenase [Natrialbaceae archaeon A-CW2]|uniref:nucleotide sugar dehydrogenase n=1 Tax=Natronosalvus amylolyticus TaxID=2961994 RepID=UPI0020C9E0FE|nr:nucleotide sugar dehydrogenase [Natronosalvus amylolyticus]